MSLSINPKDTNTPHSISSSWSWHSFTPLHWLCAGMHCPFQQVYSLSEHLAVKNRCQELNSTCDKIHFLKNRDKGTIPKKYLICETVTKNVMKVCKFTDAFPRYPKTVSRYGMVGVKYNWNCVVWWNEVPG